MSVSEDRPGCPTCVGDAFISFDWDEAERGQLHVSGRPPVNVRGLRVVGSAKGGDILRCSRCGRSYSRTTRRNVSDHRPRTASVPADRETWLREWSAGPLRPRPDVWAGLRAIAATPVGDDGLAIPCRSVLDSGEDLDPALFLFRRGPPIESWISRAVWAPQVRVVAPSRLALPPSVRLAVSRAEEVTNGFYPTCVVTPDGQDLTLNGLGQHFLDESEVSAPDLRVVEDDSVFGPEGRKHGPLVFPMLFERITCVIADLMPEDEALRFEDR